MKKTIYYLLTALTVIAAVACTKSEPAEIKLVDKNFTAVLEGTKTFIDPLGTKICWEEGDDIAIFDNISTEAHLFSISIVDSTNATFSGQVAEGATTFYAVYPYAAAVSRDLSAETLSATLPAEQKLGEHNASQGAFLAVAKVNDGQIAFQNVFGRIKVDVTYADVSEIVIGGTNLAGTASFNSTDGTIASVTDGKASVKLLPKDGEDVIAPGTYYLSLLPGTTSAGNFSVTMKRPVAIEEGELAYSASSTATAAVEVKQKGGINFANIDTKLEWTLHIDTADELIAWNNSYANWKANDKVFLDADIDLSTATPTSKADVDGSNWTAHAFPGTFDGQNHAIKNIHVENEGDANFFGTVSGTVKNLTFGAASDDDSYFRCTAATGSCYVAPIRYATATAKLEQITNYSSVELSGNSGYYVAGVCANNVLSSNQSINCINYGTIKLTGAPTTVINVAGVFGSCTNNIKYCENYGTVSIECPSTSANAINCGGIVGYTSKNVTFSNCRNSGALTITDDFASPGALNRIGGIVGYNQGEGVKLDTCINAGNILCNAANTKTYQIYMGGMIGEQQSKSAIAVSIMSCTNNGNITASITANAGNVAIGGMIGYRDYNATAAPAALIGAEGKPCINTGILSDYSSRATSGKYNTYIGGIMGFNNMSATLSYCTNGSAIDNTLGKIVKSCPSGTTNYTAIGGIIGWQSTNTLSTTSTSASLANCTNYAAVTDKNDCGGTYVYLGSMIAANERLKVSDVWKYFTVTLSNCLNEGEISNYGTCSSQLRIGGYVGDNANKVAISNSINRGNIINNSATKSSANMRMGGFVGSASASSQTLTNLTNTGNIVCNNTSSTALTLADLGGIIGYTSTTISITGCKSSCEISKSGSITTTNGRLIVADAGTITVSNCGVAGNVLGTQVTSSNYSDYVSKATTLKGSGNYYLGSANESFNELEDDITLE